MSQTHKIKPSSVQRQCDYLYVLGKEITQINTRWLSWETREIFSSKLREYCKLHGEMKAFLREHYKKDAMIMERVQQLPDIHFKDLFINEVGWKSFLSIALSYIFSPFAYRQKYVLKKYIRETRDKLHTANGLYGSIAFLTKSSSK